MTLFDDLMNDSPDFLDMDRAYDERVEKDEQLAEAWQLLMEASLHISDVGLLSRVNSFISSVEG